MAAKRFPIRWWLTTGLAALFVLLFAVGLFAEWPWLLMWCFLLGFIVVLWIIERHNEREADVHQIWWVPSSVLWAKPLRVVLSIVLMLAMFVAAGFIVFDEAGPWLYAVVVIVSLAHRLALGRKWLKQDRAAVASA